MIVELSGGLGNQMFEYAAARCVQLQNGDEIRFNLYPFRNDPQREYSLGHFALDRECKKLTNLGASVRGTWSEFLCHLYHRMGLTRGEQSFRKLASRKLLLTFDVYKHYPIDASVKGYYWKGNFQSEKYFPGIKWVLQKDFKLTEELSSEAQSLVSKMREGNSVCVHIRRGDYVTNPVDHKILDLCDETYYQKAMQYVSAQVENPIFYVFSNDENDLQWIQDNYKLPGNIIYVNLKQPDYMELSVMSQCKHFIISNSTFSWWAQYLAENEGKVVVAPSIWYNGDMQDASDIYDKNWHLIDVSGDKA